MANTSNDSILAVTLASGADDFAGDLSTTGVLAVGGTVTGAIEASADLDMFKVALQANRSYTFATVMPGDASGPHVQLYSNTWLVLSDASGKELASAVNYAKATHLSFTAPATSTYHLSYTHNYASHISVNAYTVRAADITGDTRKPMLTPMNASELDLNGALLLAADEYLNAQGPADYLNANEQIQLVDAAGDRQQTRATMLDFGTHSVLSINPDEPLAPGARYTLKFGSETVADYAGNYVAPASFTFTTSTNTLSVIQGGLANDLLYGSTRGGSRFFGGGGDDTIYASGYTDTSLYANNRALYTVTKGVNTITVASSAEGRDTLYNVERLEFADKVIIFHHDGIEGQGYRMYRAVFNREPDAAGLGFYVNLLETGYTLYTISPFFVASPEFKGMYGSNPGNRDFIERLYQNVLHRDGEAEGVKFWVDLLDRKVLTQSEVVVGFSESPENIAATATLIGNGFEYIPYG